MEMNKRLIPFLVAGVLILLAVVLSYSGRQTPPLQTESHVSNIGPTIPSSQKPKPAPVAPPSKPTTSKPSQPKSSIAVLTPRTGDRWVIGENHDVKWSAETGRTGEMYLVNTGDGSIVGWIHSSLGIHQTFFTWDTKNVFLSRSSPSRKEIGTGTYIIKFRFDGPIPSFESGPFSIIYPTQATIPVHAVSIQGASFVPLTVSAKQREKIVFTNNDAVSYQIRIANISPPYTVLPGDSFTFDTSVFTPGTYPLYSEAYPSLRGSLVVQ
jgi:hypothetical protein